MLGLCYESVFHGLLHLLTIFTFLPCTDSIGQLSLDEFIDGARKDKWVMKMLQMDMNPKGWIVERRRKSAEFEE